MREISKAKLLIWFAVFFCIGVAVASVFAISSGIVFLGVAMALLVLFTSPSRLATVRYIVVCLFVALIGVLWANYQDEPNRYLSFIGVQQEFEGLVASEVETRDTRQQFYFLPDGYHQKILVTSYTFGGREVMYGDRLRVWDKLELPKNFSDFDYRAYLEKENVYAVMRSPGLQVLDGGQGSWIVHKSLRLRDFLTRRLSDVVPEPQFGLLRGILLGQKRALPDDLYDQFVLTGTSHIVAVSGYNVSIIIAAFLSLARFVGRRSSIVIALVGITVFTIMVGATASVLRASIMGAILALSMSAGRLYRPVTALCLAAGIMVAINPKILLHDVGFQLSFIATLGIMLFVSAFEAMRISEKFPRWFKSLLFPTLAASLATAPLIALQFKTVSLISLPVNLLILPAVPFAMLCGSLAAIPYIGLGLGFIANLLLAYMIWIVNWTAGLRFAQITFPISLWEFFALTIAVASLYSILTKKAAVETDALL